MAAKMRFIEGDVFDRPQKLALLIIDDPINEQEWIAVRKTLYDLFDLYHFVWIYQIIIYAR